MHLQGTGPSGSRVIEDIVLQKPWKIGLLSFPFPDLVPLDTQTLLNAPYPPGRLQKPGSIWRLHQQSRFARL